MIITGSCWPGCWTASTAPRPISPPSTTRSRRIWSLSRQRRHGWMRYPASERLPPRSSSPRSGWTCPAFPPPGTCVRGPSSHPDSTPPPAKPRATAPPATATATWPASSARPPWWPAEPIPSSVPGIGASPNGEVTNAPSSRSGARSYSSSGTCAPATTRGSQISEPTTSPNTSTRMPRNATTSANWKPSATPSPLPRPPEPPPKSTPDQRRPVTPRARTRRQVTIIFGLGLDDPSADRPVLHCNFGGALGVVFGDIGTSPITIQTAVDPNDPLPVPISTDNVDGVVSLIFWSVMIIVTLTYVTLVMRADNDGGGSIMALITLLRRYGGAAGSSHRQ